MKKNILIIGGAVVIVVAAFLITVIVIKKHHTANDTTPNSKQAPSGDDLARQAESEADNNPAKALESYKAAKAAYEKSGDTADASLMESNISVLETSLKQQSDTDATPPASTTYSSDTSSSSSSSGSSDSSSTKSSAVTAEVTPVP